MDPASCGTTALHGMRGCTHHTTPAGPDVSGMSATRSGHLPNAPDQARACSPSPEAGCSVAGCDNPAGASGLCDRCFLDKPGGSVWQPNNVLSVSGERGERND
jgi:hypothetical protein